LILISLNVSYRLGTAHLTSLQVLMHHLTAFVSFCSEASAFFLWANVKGWILSAYVNLLEGNLFWEEWRKWASTCFTTAIDLTITNSSHDFCYSPTQKASRVKVKYHTMTPTLTAYLICSILYEIFVETLNWSIKNWNSSYLPSYNRGDKLFFWINLRFQTNFFSFLRNTMTKLMRAHIHNELRSEKWMLTI
jgi:hypothetical protein